MCTFDITVQWLAFQSLLHPQISSSNLSTRLRETTIYRKLVFLNKRIFSFEWTHFQNLFFTTSELNKSSKLNSNEKHWHFYFVSILKRQTKSRFVFTANLQSNNFDSNKQLFIVWSDRVSYRCQNNYVSSQGDSRNVGVPFYILSRYRKSVFIYYLTHTQTDTRIKSISFSYSLLKKCQTISSLESWQQNESNASKNDDRSDDKLKTGTVFNSFFKPSNHHRRRHRLCRY